MDNLLTTASDVSTRTLTVKLTSHLNDALWAAAVNEIKECIEQIAWEWRLHASMTSTACLSPKG